MTKKDYELIADTLALYIVKNKEQFQPLFLKRGNINKSNDTTKEMFELIKCFCVSFSLKNQKFNIDKFQNYLCNTIIKWSSIDKL